jgi:UDP-glucose 4-epimerase
MRCFVTGGAGFIGSHLVDRLVEEGHDLTVIDLLTTGSRDNINEQILDENRFIQMDVTGINPDAWDEYDVIFHVAAEARIQPSLSSPEITNDSNITGTQRMLEMARATGAKFIYPGSSSYYGGVYKNPYTFTKWVGEEYCKLYHEVFRVPVAIARFFNVYGSRQLEVGPYSTVVGIFEKQKREDKSLTVVGDGCQRRDFTHVNDIVSGLIQMAKLEYSELNAQVYNLGTGRNHSILELADLFKPTKIDYLPARMGEARETLADIEATKKQLDWKPTVKLEDYVDRFLADLS